MSRSAVRVRPGQDRTSLYEGITNKIIAELEAGRLPWVQPWGASGVSAPLAMPKNAATGRGYSGINVLFLWGAVVQHGFSTQSRLTFRQALGLGGNVRTGDGARLSSIPTASFPRMNAAVRVRRATKL